MTIKAQAELLSINRTALYRKAKDPWALEIRIKHLIDRIHTAEPFKGSRRIRDDTNGMNLGFRVNRKRIQRYMQEMGIRVIHPGPDLSKRSKAQYVYPYLLRNVHLFTLITYGVSTSHTWQCKGAGCTLLAS